MVNNHRMLLFHFSIIKLNKILLIVISLQDFARETTAQSNRMKGRKNIPPWHFQSSLHFARALHRPCLPRGSQDPGSLACPVHRVSGAVKGLYLPFSLWVTRHTEFLAMTPSTAPGSLLSAVANANATRNQEDLLIRLCSEKYFSIQEKQQHKCGGQTAPAVCLWYPRVKDLLALERGSRRGMPSLDRVAKASNSPTFREKGKYRFACKFPNS